MVILIDKCIPLWVYIQNWVRMNLDLDNIPRWTKSLLGEPKSGKFEDDITTLTWLHRFKIDISCCALYTLVTSSAVACD